MSSSATISIFKTMWVQSSVETQSYAILTLHQDRENLDKQPSELMDFSHEDPKRPHKTDYQREVCRRWKAQNTQLKHAVLIPWVGRRGNKWSGSRLALGNTESIGSYGERQRQTDCTFRQWRLISIYQEGEDVASLCERSCTCLDWKRSCVDSQCLRGKISKDRSEDPSCIQQFAKPLIWR